MKNAVILLTLCLPLGILAQTSTQQEAVNFISFSKGKVLSLAEKFTDAQYDWRPGDGVRSTREVMMHIAGTNYFVMSAAGFTLPEGLDPWALEKTVTARADVIKTLTESYDFLTSHLVEILDDQLGDAVKFPFPGEYTKLSAVMLAVDHCGEHLGQLIAYARMNGVVPPWSEGGK
jgi:uncharacterized damage-inducible protein DinB